MRRVDRALGILLLLRGGTAVSARALATRFEVTPRTIYRDVAALSTLGVPVYAEHGRHGGFRLLDGYFLAPVTFTQGEGLALMIGLALLDSLRSKPFAADLETAENKLLAAVSETLRPVLRDLRQMIGIEMALSDIFHPERPLEASDQDATSVPSEARPDAENSTLTQFVRAAVSHGVVAVRYQSPYRGHAEQVMAEPLGAFWDRGYWYLVGRSLGPAPAVTPRIWRADRVRAIHAQVAASERRDSFDIRAYLGRGWLRTAMRQWAEEAPVRLRLTQRQFERLQDDWYYRHAVYEHGADGAVVMTFGETEKERVFELVRWLGVGAEVLEPRQWRAEVAAHLAEMMATHTLRNP